LTIIAVLSIMKLGIRGNSSHMKLFNRIQKGANLKDSLTQKTIRLCAGNLFVVWAAAGDFPGGANTDGTSCRHPRSRNHGDRCSCRAVADRHIVDALARAAKGLGYNFIEGMTQSKDSFYGQHRPESMPCETRLKERWEAWRRGNVLTSEMESYQAL